MAVSIIGSIATLAGLIIVLSTIAYLGYWVWKNKRQTVSLKNIEETIESMLGENDGGYSENTVGAGKILRPWVCIHCGSANPATENICEQCGKESQG